MQTSGAVDRCISYFPPAYDRSSTPYKNSHLHPLVHSACTKGLRCKVVAVGDVQVGKTSLIQRYSRRLFERDYKATIGVDFEVVHVHVCACSLKLQIWDTAGQERFRCISSAYYKGAQALLLVFDMSDVKSLYSCETWMLEALAGSARKQQKNNNKFNHSNKYDNTNNTNTNNTNVNNGQSEVAKTIEGNSFYNDDYNSVGKVFLVGTKKDLLSSRECVVVEEQARELAMKLQVELCIVSSKTGDGVEDLFSRVAVLSLEDLLIQSSLPSIHDVIKLSTTIHDDDDDPEVVVGKRRAMCC